MKPRVLLENKQLEVTLTRLCYQLIEVHNDFSNTVIIGLQPRGIYLAHRIQKLLEGILKKVEESWRSVDFTVIPHKDSKDVFILGGTDEIQQLLDDSNINISTIASSRHVGPIKPKVDDWSKNLELFGKTLDSWLNCQRSWLYLESIFSAPDIQRQLPSEAKMFMTVDKSWKDIMRKTNKIPAAMRAGIQPGLYETFQQNNILLDQIMKCLEAYLESKRLVFPRFFFLSDD